MTEERLKILLDNEVITQKVFDTSNEIYIKYFKEEDYNIDKVNVFMTHFAMALKRIEDGNAIEKLDEEIFGQVKNSDVYKDALKFSNNIVEDLYLDIPESEEEYFILHLGNILMGRG